MIDNGVTLNTINLYKDALNYKNKDLIDFKFALSQVKNNNNPNYYEFVPKLKLDFILEEYDYTIRTTIQAITSLEIENINLKEALQINSSLIEPKVDKLKFVYELPELEKDRKANIVNNNNLITFNNNTEINIVEKDKEPIKGIEHVSSLNQSFSNNESLVKKEYLSLLKCYTPEKDRTNSYRQVSTKTIHEIDEHFYLEDNPTINYSISSKYQNNDKTSKTDLELIKLNTLKEREKVISSIIFKCCKDENNKQFFVNKYGNGSFNNFLYKFKNKDIDLDLIEHDIYYLNEEKKMMKSHSTKEIKNNKIIEKILKNTNNVAFFKKKAGNNLKDLYLINRKKTGSK